jgi:hypothetical protein
MRIKQEYLSLAKASQTRHRVYDWSYDSYKSYDVRFDPNPYVEVSLQKFVLTEDGVA